MPFIFVSIKRTFKKHLIIIPYSIRTYRLNSRYLRTIYEEQEVFLAVYKKEVTSRP